MTTQGSHHRWGITPEELYLARQRAHAERVKFVHEFLAALLSWRLKSGDGRAAAEPDHRHAGA